MEILQCQGLRSGLVAALLVVLAAILSDLTQPSSKGLPLVAVVLDLSPHEVESIHSAQVA